MIGVLDAAYLGVWVVWKSCMMVAGVVKANFNIRSLPLPPPPRKTLLPQKSITPKNFGATARHKHFLVVLWFIVGSVLNSFKLFLFKILVPQTATHFFWLFSSFLGKL